MGEPARVIPFPTTTRERIKVEPAFVSDYVQMGGIENMDDALRVGVFIGQVNTERRIHMVESAPDRGIGLPDIEAYLRAQMREGNARPGAEMAAAHLGVGKSTLERKLRDHGTTWARYSKRVYAGR